MKSPKSLHKAANQRYPPIYKLLLIQARFGDSLLVGDLNGDGIADITVGSPFSYGRDQSYPLAGKIDIFFLNKTV